MSRLGRAALRRGQEWHPRLAIRYASIQKPSPLAGLAKRLWKSRRGEERVHIRVTDEDRETVGSQCVGEGRRRCRSIGTTGECNDLLEQNGHVDRQSVR